MKICYVGDIRSIHLQRWATFFRDRGHEVHIITDTGDDGKGCVVHNVGDCSPAISVKFFSAVYQIWAKTRAMRSVVRRIQPDIVHGHYATNYGFLAALCGFGPLVQTVHGSDIMVDLASRLEHRFFIRYALRRADLITSVADHITKKLKRLGVPDRSIVTFQYGIDPRIFGPPHSERERDHARIVSTRNLEWRYNLELLLRAVPHVLNVVPEASFALLGDGPDRPKLVRLAQNLGIERHVAFTGRMDPGSVAAHLQQATVYVSTSLTDGASLALLEAMACGAFPVVTDIAANQEWISEGQNGFLVPTDAPEVLAERIVLGLQNEELRQRAMARNFALVQERGLYEHNMARMETLYETLVRCRVP